MTSVRLLAAPGTLVSGEVIVLAPAEAHHLRVRRIPRGSAVICLDGAGVMAEAQLLDDGATLWIGQVTSTPMPAPLVLAVGAGDKARFLALAERCTELGATRLVPLDTERARDVATRIQSSTLERARVRAREACKQSGNPWATSVDAVTSLARLAADPSLTWLLASREGEEWGSIAPRDAIGWIVGPEGGLTASELAECTGRLGARPMRLGRHTLRFDTAAIAAAVVTLHHPNGGG